MADYDESANRFAGIGLMAGLVATLGAEASLYYLQEQVFEQEFNLHYWVWIAGPLAGMIIIAGLGIKFDARRCKYKPR